MLFPNEDAYDAMVRQAAGRHGIPAPLIKAVIAQESRFTPSAYKFEPFSPSTATDDDASRGLMQVLYRTATGELGYTGPRGDDGTRTGGLYLPAISIDLGTAYLRRQLERTGGDVLAALSAYNGGYRPRLAFGARAPAGGLVLKNAAGVVTRTIPAGEFHNQAYVNAVRGYVRYFANQIGQSADTVEAEAAASVGSPATAPLVIGLVVLGLWLFARLVSVGR